MGFLDRLLGREPLQTQGGYAGSTPAAGPAPVPSPPSQAGGQGGGPSADERAIARYRYLLRTAPPESLEQVHAEAFAQLTPEQREQVLAELSSGLPAGEAAPTSDPQSMARAATRAELRQPGYLEQTFSRGRFGGGGMGGMGMGGTIMGSMMGTIAGVVIGSAIAEAMFDGYDSSPEAAKAGDTTAAADGGAESSDASGSDGADGSGGSAGSGGSDGSDAGGVDQAADAGQDSGYDAGGFDSGGFDSGGFDSGGFGGGDFGGGDMGGF
jgi:hypothetical protein